VRKRKWFRPSAPKAYSAAKWSSQGLLPTTGLLDRLARSRSSVGPTAPEAPGIVSGYAVIRPQSASSKWGFQLPTNGLLARFGDFTWTGCAFLRRNRNAAPKSIGKHKATSQEPARTSVSSSRTFVPLLTTEGLCILLPKSFKRERGCLMKLGIFILLLVANLPSGVSYVRGVEKSATLFDGGI